MDTGHGDIPSAEPVISLRNISKSFEPRRVLDRISLEIRRGEIHALLGQNGSGKSTLIKILSGIYEPDRRPTDAEPQVMLNATALQLPLSPAQAVMAGIAAVHQDLPIIGTASVLENLRIGRFKTSWGWRIKWRREQADARRALADFGIEARPDQPANELSEADRAMLAILRGLQGLPSDRPGLLILDEPTAHLPRDGVDRVFAAIRQVALQGHAVMLVTHRLDEVFAVANRVSVIRDGAICHAAATSQTTERELIKAILGFDIDELYPEREDRDGETVLLAEDFHGERVQDLSFAVRRGEILGFTGLMGAGQEEVPYLLFGARPARRGTITMGGSTFRQSDLTPSAAMSKGIALLPADRREASGVGTMTVCENISLPALDSFFKGGFLRRKAESDHARALAHSFDVRPAQPELLLSSLSGGNQQKALLAKWFQLKPSVLLLHEPTHGVDVGSRRTIFRLIQDAAASGTAVVLFSTEYADLANLCDRVIVMRHGRKAAELGRSQLSEDRIVALAMMNDPSGVTNRPTADGPHFQKSFATETSS